MTVLEDYYTDIPEGVSKLLLDLWNHIKASEPRATEGLSYGYPALKLNGRPLIGFSVSKNHLSIYPFSPKVISSLKNDLDNQGFEYSKGVIRFSSDKPITKSLVNAILHLRRAELETE